MMPRPEADEPDPLPPTLPVQAFADLETLLRPRNPGEGDPAPCEWALVVYAGPQLGRFFPLAPGENVVGRAPGTAIALPDEEVSRAHACLRLEPSPEGDRLTLVDLGSTNGTFVNGTPVADLRMLAAGDRVEVGGHVLKVVALDPLERSFHETLLDQSTRDPLTGLSNRGAILGELQNRFDLSRRHGRPLSVVMADLDHFKAINDTHGHGTGDLVLSAFGELVRQNLRGTDLAGRIGGEEFLMVLPETEQSGALQLAERIRASLERMGESMVDGPIGITCSLGVGERSPEDREAGDLMGRADRALYEAKHGGRNRVVSAGSKRR